MGIARATLLDDLALYAIIPLPKDGRMYVMSAQEEGPIPKIQPPVAISHPSRQSHVTILQSRQREETITSTLLIAASNLSFLFFWQFISPQVQSRTSDSPRSHERFSFKFLILTHFVIASTKHDLSPNRQHQYKIRP